MNLEEKLSSDGISLKLCPTVNGFEPCQVEAEEYDGPIIEEFLLNSIAFNEATQKLAQLRENSGTSVDESSEDELLNLIKTSLEEKVELDRNHFSIGVFAEGVFENGLITDLSYTSPRERWNPATRRQFSLEIAL